MSRQVDYSPQAVAARLAAGETASIPPGSLLGLQIQNRAREEREKEDKRPGFTIFAAILYMLGACAMVGILAVLQGLKDTTRLAFGEAAAQELARSLSAYEFLFLAVFCVDVALAYGLLRGRTWSRVLSMIVTSIGMAVSLWNIGNHKSGADWVLFSYWTSMVIGGAMFFGMDRPRVRRYYNSRKTTSIFD